MSNNAARALEWNDVPGWSRVLEHRSRLGACALLSRVDALSFRRLKDLLESSDGNLGANLKRLEDDGLISSQKQFDKRRPVTWYTLTARGKEALHAHLDALDRIVSNVRGTKS